jgi:Tfp pilus assembly protein PilX
MNESVINFKQKPFKLQRGVVLFIALIALVVMSLAAVALIRSVDTNTVIAGNLSFKQSALISSDRGVETALAWVDAKSKANVTDLDSDSAVDGYYATYLTPNLDDPAVLKDAATWDEDNSAAAAGTGIKSGGTEEVGGKNNIRYIVQRMCREAVEPTADKCLFGADEVGSSGRGVKDATEAGAIVSSLQSPMYRITVRVTGSQNTVSYAQTFVY